MILVTVGTHEDPFDRLLAAADALGAELGEEVVIQAQSTHLVLQHARRIGVVEPPRLESLARQARLVVTHAGPGSILVAARAGHVPIVVPRDPRHGEHVDSHQVLFARRLQERVHVVEDPADLASAVRSHDDVVARLQPLDLDGERSMVFAKRLGALVEGIVTTRVRRRERVRATLSAARSWAQSVRVRSE